MCGVLAIHHLSDNPIDASLAIKSLETLNHRGPDGTKQWLSPSTNTFLGHTLLSINPPKHEKVFQPFETRNAVLIFNGELYNTAELHAALIQNNIIINGISDTEILAAGIDHFGWCFLDKIEGCWSLVRYCLRTQSISIARDPNSEKQLVYSLQNNIFIAASEAKAISCYLKQKGLNESRIFRDLIFDFFADRTETYFKGIFNAPTDGVYTYSSGGKLMKVYQYASKRAAKGLLRQALSQSVKKMLPTHYPAAMVLSGGLDSSIIAALIKIENQDKHYSAVTVGYSNIKNEDIRHAQTLALHLGKIDHHIITLSEKDLRDNYQAAQSALEEPFQDQVYISQYLLYKKMKALGYRVAFNGQGADEFWGGYQDHYPFISRVSRSRQHIENHYRDIAVQRQLHRFISELEINNLITSNIDRCLPGTPIFEDLLSRCHLPAMLLHEDQLSMKHGIELRLPFLDGQVIAEARDTFYSHNNQSIEKWRLREAVKGILYEPIRVRKKQAFPDSPTTLYVSTSMLLEENSDDSFFTTTQIRSLSKSNEKIGWRLAAVNNFKTLFGAL